MKSNSIPLGINHIGCEDGCCSHTPQKEQHDSCCSGHEHNHEHADESLFDLSAIRTIASSADRPDERTQFTAVAGEDTGGGTRTVYRLSGLDCGDCAMKLEKRIAALPGVSAASVNFSTAKMTVLHTTADQMIIRTVQQAGYGAEVETSLLQQPSPPAQLWKNRRVLATVLSGLLLGCALVLDWSAGPRSVAIALYSVAIVTGGFHAARSAVYSLRALSLDMNVLMTAAVIGAAILGEWSEGAAVAFLFSFGNALQAYTMEKTRRSIQSLMALAPAEALVKRGDVEELLAVEEIAVGDVIIVRPGERIAMDGKIIQGASAVNQATITGESIPVEKTKGDTVYAGTMNEDGVLEIEVTQLAADSTLAKIFHLIEEAQAQKAPSQQFVDVFARYYTPLVLIVAAGVMILPWLVLHQPFTPWFYNGLVLLVISCPCALVISTPVSIVSAIGNASRNGVLIKGGAYLEEMGTIKSIAFDKTGTLTQGRAEVTDVIVFNGYSENQALALAAGIEHRSEHPLAQAVMKRAGDIVLPSVMNFKALPGRGAQAEVEGHLTYIGNARLFTELGHDLIPYQEQLLDLEKQGKTAVLLGTREQVAAIFAVADILRENSKATVKALHKAGLKHVAMLTGDNEQTAASIAKALELDAFYSELLPEDKVSAVQKMHQKYGKVAMVGDGVNDAPALATATVGIAMGVAGSDTALETADIALMTDDLGKLAYIIRLSRKTVAVIQQNIIFSIVIKVIFMILLLFNMATLWLAVFADTGASLLVTLNGMRLMRRLRDGTGPTGGN
ncbi:heavy metal translocating P-type ATPase [Desulfobulbus oligotrophicus]|uniref:P-type Zn(2+) transporter n=1 Tax=Desulfobulbus oligotrophicus TaxID=1909699 RepID=A0A7T6ARF9_9BACT|nr:heavy metal translocating P-type ATPase [Desulfobulbus oligotrophicus]QQG66498.1 cadmium-translocating P-type ATPase [Desulfobulbus oligotrophicus]